MSRFTLQIVMVALASFIVSFSAQREADACSCAPPNLIENYNWSTDVIRVRVLGHREHGGQIVHLAVVRTAYKGCTERGDFVVLTSPSSGAACGVTLSRGNWLVNAQARRPGVFEISSCGYNLPWRRVDDDDRAFLESRYVCCGEDCACVNDDEVLCFADPCSVTSCDEGECYSNYCGGCHAEFYTESGQAVCNACDDDSDCAFNQVCTDDGCRTACSDDRDCPDGFCGRDRVCHDRADLSIYYTCGDPVCRGHMGDPDIPRCPEGVSPGDLCRDPSYVCDPGDSCNRLLVCSDTDPTSHGCPISRRDAKRDITYLAEDERAALTDELLSMRLATYNYVFEPEDAERQLGFIIEDIEPSAAVDAERDMVDLYGYLSMTVAAIQTQSAEIEALRAEVEALRAARSVDHPASCEH